MQWLWEVLFPKKCVNCGREGKYVCSECEVGLWEEEQICPVCCRASRYGLRHKYCREPYSLDGLTALWAYEGIARRLIAKAKYTFRYDYLREFSNFNYQFSNKPEFNQFLKFLEMKPVAVAVPLYKNREKWRGFNQAEMIAKWVGETWELSTQKLLERVKDTGQQMMRNRVERLVAMEDAFRINGQVPKNILLVDDVWTSGATMRECAKVLKKSGVKKVWGLVLAR